jgi:DNA polymerase IV (DinB-like DNA polymerase)
LVAKIASDFRKPDGLVIVQPNEVQNFLADLGVSKIVGIGKKTEERLNQIGVRTIGELAKLDIFTLTEEFGKKNGVYIFNASRGIDNEPVVETDAITQISRIMTLKKSSNLLEEMLPDLQSLCRDVQESVAKQGFSFKSVGIILIRDDLSIKTKTRTLKSPSSGYDEIVRTASELLEEALPENELMVRRLGVKVSELISTKGQDTLSRFMEG